MAVTAESTKDSMAMKRSSAFDATANNATAAPRPQKISIVSAGFRRGQREGTDKAHPCFLHFPIFHYYNTNSTK